MPALLRVERQRRAATRKPGWRRAQEPSPPGLESGHGRGKRRGLRPRESQTLPFLHPLLVAMAPALLLVSAALASFILAFGTGVEFVRFTSLRPLLGGIPESAGPDAHQGWLAALQDQSILVPLAWDLGLLLLFVGQHSLMATETVKAWMSRYFGVLQRSLYVACTALTLQLVMRSWEPISRGPVLWAAQAEPWATWVPLLCFVLHVISWLLIFSILLVFDYAELMGLKQSSFSPSSKARNHGLPGLWRRTRDEGQEPNLTGWFLGLSYRRKFPGREEKGG
nr:nurim isoform X2 [Manis javanica]XP_036882667.1 nurim-like isoform X1 [Manis javanica]